MRREGFEMTGVPAGVLCGTIDGDVQEPYERITIDIPPESSARPGGAGRAQGAPGAVTTDAEARPDGVRFPAVRGLIGYRGQSSRTRGERALLHQSARVWAVGGGGDARTNGVLRRRTYRDIECLRAVQHRGARRDCHQAAE